MSHITFFPSWSSRSRLSGFWGSINFAVAAAPQKRCINRVTLLPRKSFQLRPDLTANEDDDSLGGSAAVSPDYADIDTRIDAIIETKHIPQPLPPPSARTGPTMKTSNVRALNLVRQNIAMKIDYIPSFSVKNSIGPPLKHMRLCISTTR